MSKITQNLVGGGLRVRWCRCAAELMLVWPRAIVAVDVAYHDQHGMNEPLSVKHSSEQCYTSNIPFLLFDFRPGLHSIQYELWKHSFVRILTMKCLTIALTHCCSIFFTDKSKCISQNAFPHSALQRLIFCFDSEHICVSVIFAKMGFLRIFP